MGGVLAGELCSTRRKCLPYLRGFRRKLRQLSRRSSNAPRKLVFYDVRNFTLAELSLLVKKHAEDGACRTTIYQYEGCVHVLQPEQLFQKSSRPTSRTPTGTARTPDTDSSGRFRIVLVSEYEDPFYLRTMALQLEHLEAEAQLAEAEKPLVPEQTQSYQEELATARSRQVKVRAFDDEEEWYSASSKGSSKGKQPAVRPSSCLTAKNLTPQKGTKTPRGSLTKAQLFAASLKDLPSHARSPQPEKVPSHTSTGAHTSMKAPHSVYL
ncbi:hypothetical protein Aduo_008666 [Ancylostoma duodenale]